MIGTTVLLKGDNFQVPNVGIRGTVTQVGKIRRLVKVEWVDGKVSWFTQYQFHAWTCVTKD